MDEKVNILIAGDVRGEFETLFERVESALKKASFEILFCVGDFFGTKEKNDYLNNYKNGNKLIPIPTYILGPNSEDSTKLYDGIIDDEICPNLIYLGKRGLFTLSSGVKVAYLSGLETPSNLSNKTEGYFFNKDDISALVQSCVGSNNTATNYRGVDVLLTSQWPLGMKEKCNKSASKLISYLSKSIRPRYHYCGLNGKFYESPPFSIPADDITSFELISRFISMAKVNNEKKKKYLHALSLVPVDKMRVLDLILKTTDTTECPYLKMDFFDCVDSNKKSAADTKQYFYDTQSHNERQPSRKRALMNFSMDKDQQGKQQKIDIEKCWFCLSSPDVEKHLVISVGEWFYLALPKGPINDYHVLIVPIEHKQSSRLLDDQEWHELNKFKEAIKKFFADQNLLTCFSERNYRTSHLQIHALGVQRNLGWKFHHSFEDTAQKYTLRYETFPLLNTQDMLPLGPFFYVEYPDRTLITRQMKQFPMPFQREVFCSPNLLNCPEVINWRQCQLTKDEEIETTKDFRKKFEKYDFTKS